MMIVDFKSIRIAGALLLAGLGLAAACTKASPGVSPPTTAAPVTPSHAPVPDQLWGTWQPVVAPSGPADRKNMVFSAHSFAAYDDVPMDGVITRAWAAGPDQVVLGVRGQCPSNGTYTWKIDTAGLLTLSGGTDDQCPRRHQLTSTAFKKISSNTYPADTDITQ
jgi:hypothetical protein